MDQDDIRQVITTPLTSDEIIEGAKERMVPFFILTESAKNCVLGLPRESRFLQDTVLYVFYPQDDKVEFCQCTSVFDGNDSEPYTIVAFTDVYRTTPAQEVLETIFGGRDIDALIDPQMEKYILDKKLVECLPEGVPYRDIVSPKERSEVHKDLYDVAMGVVSGYLDSLN